MNRKKLIIAGAALAILLVVGAVLLLNRKSDPGNLVATDLVAANIKFTDDIEQPDTDRLRFFTGTSLAELAVEEGEALRSKSLSEDLPFYQAKTVRESGSLLAVKAYYDSGDLLAIESAGEPLQNGDEWFVFDKGDSKIRSVRQATGKAVSDVYLSGGSVYVLADNSGKATLLKFNSNLDKSETLAQDLEASVFVGIVGDTVLVRDLKGVVYALKPGSGATKLAENVAEAKLDRQSGKLVVSEQTEAAFSEEGGSFSKNSEQQKLVIHDVSSGTSSETLLPGAGFFVSKGFILIPSGVQQPTMLTYYDLSNQDTGSVDIDQSGSKNIDQIKSLQVMRTDLSRIAVVTNFDQMMLLESPKLTPPAPYKLPLIRDNLGQFGYNYDIGKNLVAIYYSVGDEDVVENSISDLATLCKCDVNQVGKQWEAISTSPGL